MIHRSFLFLSLVSIGAFLRMQIKPLDSNSKPDDYLKL